MGVDDFVDELLCVEPLGLLLTRELPFSVGVAGKARVGGGFGAGALISPLSDSPSGSVVANPIMPGAMREGGWLSTAGGYTMLTCLDGQEDGAWGAGLSGLTKSGISNMS